MEENNSSDENIQKGPAPENSPDNSPPVAGETFHPETANQPETVPMAEPPASEPSASDAANPKPELLSVPPHPIKKKSKKGLLLLLVLLLLAAGGAAWWYLQGKNVNTGQSAASARETQEIAELKVGNTEGPASVYFPDEGLLGVQTVIDHQIYEGLVGYSNNTITPLLAQSWTNPDQKTWIFKIQPNVKFHTGKAVTAKEVKAALDDLKKYDYWSIFVSTIDSVEATGDLELTIKTKEPDALLLNRLSQAYVSDITAADKAGNNGTGAYQVDTTAKNDEKSTTLIPFENYYGKRAKTRKLVFIVYDSDDSLIKGLKDKQIDIAETIPIPSVTKQIEGTGFAGNEFESPGSFGIYMNQQRSATTILKNKDIRLAIAQAMDRQGLIDKVGNKNIPATQVIPKSLSGHDESISFPVFDLAASKATLAKAGYKNTPLEFAYIKEVQQDAPVAIAQLRAAGFNIVEKAYASADLTKALADLRVGKFDLFFAGFTSDVFDARDILGSLLGSTESTYPVFSDPVYDKLLADSDKEFDPVKRIQLLQKANKYILDNLAWIPIRNSNYVSYHAKDIDIKSDFNGGGNIGAYYRKVGRITQ